MANGDAAGDAVKQRKPRGSSVLAGRVLWRQRQVLAKAPKRQVKGVLKDGRSHESKGIGRGQGVKGRDGKFKSKDDTLESVAMPCTTEAIKNPVMAAFFMRDDSPQAA